MLRISSSLTLFQYRIPDIVSVGTCALAGMFGSTYIQYPPTAAAVTCPCTHILLSLSPLHQPFYIFFSCQSFLCLVLCLAPLVAVCDGISLKAREGSQIPQGWGILFWTTWAQNPLGSIGLFNEGFIFYCILQFLHWIESVPVLAFACSHNCCICL